MTSPSGPPAQALPSAFLAPPSGPGSAYLPRPSRTVALLRSCLCLAVHLIWAPALAADKGIQYVEDIDSWRAELYIGSVNPGAVAQGPLLEVSALAALCFFPDGKCFGVGGGYLVTVSREGVVRLLAGSPSVSGYADGPASQALLGRQLSLCPDGKEGLYLGDRTNRVLRRLLQKGGQWQVETLAGDAAQPEWKAAPQDGVGKEAVFRYLHSNVIADPAGNAFLMDNNFLRRISPEGKVETLNPKGGSGKPGEGLEDLETAKFQLIMGGAICFGGDSCIYVADRWNHCIRKVDLAAKKVSVAVGPGTGYRDGPEKECGFHDSPGSIVYDPWRKRFYTNGVDDHGLRVWENGALRTIAGGNGANKGLDSPAKEASMHWCYVTAVDPLPPHAVYFKSSGSPYEGRLGRLIQASAKP